MSYPIFVLNFKILSKVVSEKSFDEKKVNIHKITRGINMENDEKSDHHLDMQSHCVAKITSLNSEFRNAKISCAGSFKAQF